MGQLKERGEEEEERACNEERRYRGGNKKKARFAKKEGGERGLKERNNTYAGTMGPPHPCGPKTHVQNRYGHIT